MPDTLAAKIRAKHPGAYDDMDDAKLEAAVTAKFPGIYDDIPRSTLPTRPVSAEDFMTPEDIANRDNGSSIAGDMARGFGKRALGSIVGLGEMAAAGGMIPGVSPAQADLFNPVMRHPFFRKADEFTAPKNEAETVGGRMELAAELAPGAIGLVKAAPGLARGAVSLAKQAGGIGPAVFDAATHLVPGGGYIRGARRLLAAALEKGGKFAEELPKVADELKASRPAVMTGTTAEAPATISAPGGFSMPPPRPAVPVAPSPGRVVPAAPRPSVEQVAADALAEARLPPPPARVTTPPQASLPPGYTPRSTVPKPVQARQAAAEQARAPRAPRAKPTASPPPNQGPPKRAYFLKSEDEIAAAAEPIEAVTPTGSIEVADLPASWQSRVGQDLFPTTGDEAKVMTAALREEIKARGMTIGQAIAAVSRNKDIPTKLRAQMVRSLAGSK